MVASKLCGFVVDLDVDMTDTPLICPIVDGPEVAISDSQDYQNRWFLVDDHGVWIGREQSAKLQSVQLAVSFGNLVLRAPGMLRLDIPMQVIEDDESVWRNATVLEKTVQVVDEGDLVAAWFGNVLGRSCRLVKVLPQREAPDFGQ